MARNLLASLAEHLWRDLYADDPALEADAALQEFEAKPGAAAEVDDGLTRTREQPDHRLLPQPLKERQRAHKEIVETRIPAVFQLNPFGVHNLTLSLPALSILLE